MRDPLVVVDCLAVRDPRFRGLLVGVAASIKLTPLIFLLYFLVRREWRAAAMSVLAFAGMAVLGFLFAAKDSAEFWFHALLDPGRAGGLAYTTNQSLRGVLPAFLALGFTRGHWARLTLGALLVIFLIHPFTWLPSTGDKEMLWAWQEHVYGDAYTWVAIGALAVLAARPGLSSAWSARRLGSTPRSRS